MSRADLARAPRITDAAAQGDRETARERGRTAIDLAVYLPHHLTVIANHWARGSSRIYLKRFGVGVNEWRILSTVAAEPGATAQRAGELTTTDKGVVSRAVRSLEAQGYVKVQANPTDGRKSALALTDAGYRLHDEIMALALERETCLLAGLSPQEVALATRLIIRMRQNLPKVNSAMFTKTAQKGGAASRE